MKRIVVLAFLVATSILTLANYAIAGPLYGAIAYSQSTKAMGWSYKAPSRAAAERIALNNCRKYANDCSIATWFSSGCGAIATGNGTGWGVGYNKSKKAAQNRALSECRKRTTGCSVKRWVCSG